MRLSKKETFLNDLENSNILYMFFDKYLKRKNEPIKYSPTRNRFTWYGSGDLIMNRSEVAIKINAKTI
jgi:hypothetical protein